MNTPTAPSTTARAVTLVILSLAAAAAIILSAGCAGQQIGLSIPIPPSGDNIGQFGYFKVGYEANALSTPFLNNWTNYVTINTNQYK